MKAIQKIKNKVIHFLGGITDEEHKKWLEYKYVQGKLFACEVIRDEMQKCYGTSAEEWCKHMYDFCDKKMLYNANMNKIICKEMMYEED